MNEEMKRAIEAAVDFVTRNAEAGMQVCLVTNGSVVPMVNDLLKIIDQQQAAIEAANAALSECQKALDIERGGDLPF